MDNSQCKNARLSRGGRIVNGVAIRTLSINEAIADALRPFAAKIIARKIETSERTVEHWKQAKTGPQAKHFVAMLNDDELAPRLLEAVGLGDLARQQEILSLNRRIEALKAEEKRHEEHVHEIRESLGSPGARKPLGGRPSRRMRDEVEKGRGAVPRSSD